MFESLQRSSVEPRMGDATAAPSEVTAGIERERERCALIAEAAAAYVSTKLEESTDEFQRGRASAARAIALAIRTSGQAAALRTGSATAKS